MKPRTIAHISVLMANIIFALNYSVVKYVSPALLKPFGLNVARVLVTTSLFWVMAAFEKTALLPRRKDLPLLVICSLTGVVINQLLFIKGLSMTYSTHASLMQLSTPVMITIVAFFFLGERITILKAIGLLLGISGSSLLIMSKEHQGGGTHVMLGNILILLNAISYAFYFVLVKPLMSQYTPLQVIRWVFTLGSMVIIPLGWSEFIEAPWSAFSMTDMAAISFIVLGATFLAYLFNMHGLRHLKASATGSYIYLQPIIAAVVALLFLSEPFTTAKAVSGMLIFSGVFLVNLRS